jgi:AcrR family transcriptional regulator
MRSSGAGAGRRLLPREERRAQILDAATRAFARDGFVATSLDDVVAEAGVTKAIIYRHFESKGAMYKEALDAIRARIRDRVGPDEQLGPESVATVIEAAIADPDGYRLLFEHARREPEFRSYSDELAWAAINVAENRLREVIPDRPIRLWVADMVVWLQIEMVLSWLRSDRPVPVEKLRSSIQAASQALVASVRQA